MRTTVRLDDALLAEAKALAARTGRTLTDVIEDALRESLARGEGRSPHKAQLPVAHGKPRPGINLDSTSDLLDIMESDAAP
jgi:ribbon-helix-helix CopG family protein